MAITERHKSQINKWKKENKARMLEIERVRYLKNRDVKRCQKYGITIEEYQSLLKIQESACAGCQTPFDDSVDRKTAYIDHCHTTGKVRGLLCNCCNRAIGSAKDDPMILRSLADYLDKSLHAPR